MFGSLLSWLAVSLSNTDAASGAGFVPVWQTWFGPGSKVAQSLCICVWVFTGASFAIQVSVLLTQ